MGGWVRHQGRAVALRTSDIDTDQLIPARFMATPRADGYGQFLLHDLRRDADGQPNEHPLNTAQPSVLLAGRNFGCGSSREAAAYALVDFGIRVVAAPSFGEIFAANAVNNGLLPARLSDEDHARMLDLVAGTETEVTVDLDASMLSLGEVSFGFELPPAWRLKLKHGWDDIDLTQEHRAAIAEFAVARRQRAPWAWPGRNEIGAP